MLEIFITATDTDAGKTYVSQALVAALVLQKKVVAVYKPISAGCEWVNEALINEDALLLMQQSNAQQSINMINPISFEPAIAPHIAAAQENRVINLDMIHAGYQKIIQLNSDVIVTEGAGGWRLPLGHGNYLSEFVVSTQQKVIIVVNMKLGCLNHAILTYESIIADGLECIGWVANSIETMNYLEENITELKSLLPIPLLAIFGFEPDIKVAASQFNLEPLL
jgi:dethiobiotin synthetase